jgi:DNA-binding NarL/FixJ family response regulator
MKLDKFSIIIADDHPFLRFGLKSALEDLDFVSTIDEAGNGEEVISLLQKNHYDIIFMDIRMPGCGGIEATSKIKQSFPEVKIIVFSMYNEERYVVELFQKGASGYLLKNADREVIIEAIKEVSEGRLYFSKDISASIIQKLTLSLNKGSNYLNKHEEDLRAIIYLICLGKVSKQIADILCLSTRTVEQYRRFLNMRFGTKNAAEIVRYGMEHGIYEDEVLKSRFSKFLVK